MPERESLLQQLEEIAARLPTGYRERILDVVASLRRPEHDHVAVLIGTGTHCVICGEFTGVTTVLFPDIDWDEWGRVRDAVASTIREHPESLPGLHADTVADWIGQLAAHKLTSLGGDE